MTVGESDDAGGSPWAGEVPVPAEPIEFSWAKSGDSEGAWLDAETNDHVDEIEPEVASFSEGMWGSERRRWAMGSIAAVILLALGWLVVGRGSGDDALDATTGDTAANDSLPTLDEAPPETEPAPERTTLPVSSNLGEGQAPEWIDDVVRLPSVLRAVTTPFDVVAMTSEGTFLELSIPSGRVTTIDLGAGVNGQVVAGATSALVVSYSTRQNGQLLRVDEAPLEIALPDNIDGLQVTADSDRYVGLVYRGGPTPDRVEIAADGSVIVSESTFQSGNVWQHQFLGDGSELVSEAGGIYRGIDGVYTRISPGVLIASSLRHLLVRECDDSMRCGYFTIETSTGERIDVIVDSLDLSPFLGFQSAQLSPDGRLLHYISFNENSIDEVLVHLSTGERTELPGASGRQGGGVWAADSSGFFRQSAALGFEFFDVATREGIRFGEDLGRVSGFDIRISAGTPTVAGSLPTTTGVELIGFTESGDIVEIDVDSRAVVTTDGDPLGSSAPATVFVDAAGAVIASYDDVDSVRFDAETRSVSTLGSRRPGGLLVPGPRPNTVWELAEGSDPGSVKFVLVDALGLELGSIIDGGAVSINDVIGSDGAGGVLVESDLGGVFVLRAPGEAERVTSGELLAIDAQTAYVRECDSSLRCGVSVLDRATDERVAIELSIFNRVGDIDGRGVPAGQNVSPDGDVVFVRDLERSEQAMMIDTVEGLWTGVPPVDLASPIIWTPDSGYAVWLSDGRVTIYERSTRSIRTVNTAELKAIGLVPSS